jgi:predicted O-methyltransferase YrrM
MEPVPRIQAVIARLLHEGTAVTRSGAVHHLFPVAIPATEGEALREWIQRERAVHTIEIGLGYGIAALFACQGLLENDDATAQHVVLDPHQATRFGNCGLQSLEEAGVTHLVEYHPEGSETALPRFLNEGRSFYLAFVDGNHRFDGVFVDLAFLSRLVRPGGVVFVDDYQLPSIRRAISFFTTNLGWKIEEVSTDDARHHWTALRTPRTPTQRPFDHYVDF